VKADNNHGFQADLPG